MSSFRDKVQANIPNPASTAEEARRIMTEDALIVADAIRRDILERAKHHRDTASKFRYDRLLDAPSNAHYGICASTRQSSRISRLFANDELQVSTTTLNSGNANLFLSALRSALQTDGIRVGNWCAVIYVFGNDWNPLRVDGVPYPGSHTGYVRPSNHYVIIDPKDDIYIKHGPYPSTQPMQCKTLLDLNYGRRPKKCEFYLGSRLLEKSYDRPGNLSWGFCLQIQYE